MKKTLFFVLLAAIFLATGMAGAAEKCCTENMKTGCAMESCCGKKDCMCACGCCTKDGCRCKETKTCRDCSCCKK